LFYTQYKLGLRGYHTLSYLRAPIYTM